MRARITLAGQTVAACLWIFVGAWVVFVPKAAEDDSFRDLEISAHRLRRTVNEVLADADTRCLAHGFHVRKTSGGWTVLEPNE